MTGPEAARGAKAVAKFLRPRSVAIVGISSLIEKEVSRDDHVEHVVAHARRSAPDRHVAVL